LRLGVVEGEVRLDADYAATRPMEKIPYRGHIQVRPHTVERWTGATFPERVFLPDMDLIHAYRSFDENLRDLEDLRRKEAPQLSQDPFTLENTGRRMH